MEGLFNERLQVRTRQLQHRVESLSKQLAAHKELNARLQHDHDETAKKVHDLEKLLEAERERCHKLSVSLSSCRQSNNKYRDRLASATTSDAHRDMIGASLDHELVMNPNYNYDVFEFQPECVGVMPARRTNPRLSRQKKASRNLHSHPNRAASAGCAAAEVPQRLTRSLRTAAPNPICCCSCTCADIVDVVHFNPPKCSGQKHAHADNCCRRPLHDTVTEALLSRSHKFHAECGKIPHIPEQQHHHKSRCRADETVGTSSSAAIATTGCALKNSSVRETIVGSTPIVNCDSTRSRSCARLRSTPFSYSSRSTSSETTDVQETVAFSASSKGELYVRSTTQKSSAAADSSYRAAEGGGGRQDLQHAQDITCSENNLAAEDKLRRINIGSGSHIVRNIGGRRPSAAAADDRHPAETIAAPVGCIQPTEVLNDYFCVLEVGDDVQTFEALRAENEALRAALQLSSGTAQEGGKLQRLIRDAREQPISVEKTSATAEEDERLHVQPPPQLGASTPTRVDIKYPNGDPNNCCITKVIQLQERCKHGDDTQQVCDVRDISDGGHGNAPSDGVNNKMTRSWNNSKAEYRGADTAKEKVSRYMQQKAGVEEEEEEEEGEATAAAVDYNKTGGAVAEAEAEADADAYVVAAMASCRDVVVVRKRRGNVDGKHDDVDGHMEEVEEERSVRFLRDFMFCRTPTAKVPPRDVYVHTTTAP